MSKRFRSWRSIRPLVQILWAVSAAGYWFGHGTLHTACVPVFLVAGFVLTVAWVRLTVRWIRHGDAAFATDRS